VSDQPPGFGYPGPPFFSDIGRFVIGYSPLGGPVLSPTTPGIVNTINSFAYDQYSDDDGVQAFAAAYNQLQAAFLYWFNTVGMWLAVYTSPSISGLLLDWVGQGIYGYARPVLLARGLPGTGPLGTIVFGFPPPFGEAMIAPTPAYYATDDDVYKRCLTWHLYRGDGKQFGIKWLKRRVMRFLLGTNGTDFVIDQTYRISVTFGTGTATIRILNAVETITGGAIFGRFGFGFSAPGAPVGGYPLGTDTGASMALSPTFAFGPTFAEAVASGALELPLMWSWSVEVIG
jgi:hypothetical protein